MAIRPSPGRYPCGGQEEGKGEWKKALAEIGEARQRAEEIIKIGSYFASAEEAGEYQETRALKLIRKAAKGSEADDAEADDRDGKADGLSPIGMKQGDDYKKKYGVDAYCFATPDWLRKAIVSEIGYPALDVASSHDMHFGRKFYSPEQDGIKQDWFADSEGGIVFVNPPYIATDRFPVPNGYTLDKWVEKSFATSQAGCIVISVLPFWRKYDWCNLVIEYAEFRLSSIPIVFEGFGPMAASNVATRYGKVAIPIRRFATAKSRSRFAKSRRGGKWMPLPLAVLPNRRISLPKAAGA